MKHQITAFIKNLIVYDYILFATVFVLFLLFIILGIVLRKRLGIALFFILLAFTLLFVGPTYGYVKLHEYIFKQSTQLISQKRLHFTNAVVVKGTLTNKSKRNFNSCKVTASAYKVTSNKYKNYLKKLKPFKKMSIVIEDIAVSQTKEFKIIVEPFTYKGDYNISLGADCR